MKDTWISRHRIKIIVIVALELLVTAIMLFCAFGMKRCCDRRDAACQAVEDSAGISVTTAAETGGE